MRNQMKKIEEARNELGALVWFKGLEKIKDDIDRQHIRAAYDKLNEVLNASD